MQKINDVGRLSVYLMCAMIGLQRRIVAVKYSNMEDTKLDNQRINENLRNYETIKKFFESK